MLQTALQIGLRNLILYLQLLCIALVSPKSSLYPHIWAHYIFNINYIYQATTQNHWVEQFMYVNFSLCASHLMLHSHNPEEKFVLVVLGLTPTFYYDFALKLRK